MSIDATRWAWQQTLPATEKLILLSLADRAGETHEAWPSQARLCADTGLDRRTIWAALARLEAAGLVRVTRKHRQPNRYTLVGVPDRHESLGYKTGPQAKTLRYKNGPQVGTKLDLKVGTKLDHQSTNEPTKNPAAGAQERTPAQREAALAALAELTQSFGIRRGRSKC